MALVIKKKTLNNSSFYANDKTNIKTMDSDLGDYHCELFQFLRLNLVATANETILYRKELFEMK